MDYKMIAMVVMTAVFVYGMLLEELRRRSAMNPVPENVRDVYDDESYLTWRRYHGEKVRWGMVAKAVSYLVEMALIAADLYARFASLFPDTDFMRLFGVLLLSALGGLISLPLEYYDTMVIEEKYGFNRATKKTFFLDQVKNFVISLVLITLIASLLMGIHKALGDLMVPVFAAAMTVLMLGFTFLYPVFSRVFNKFTPLEDGELKEQLTALMDRHGYSVRAIQVMDASRRTSKSNAYFTGFGRMKTIVLYDTLVAAMDTDEICAVFAHEMGHGLHHDTLKNQILSFFQMLILGALALWTLSSPEVFSSFGFDRVNYGFAVILIMSVEYALIAPLVGLIASFMSRRAEYRADAQAAKEGYAAALVSGLKKLSRANFSDLAPHPLLVRLEYSHPTLSQRIAALDALKEKEEKK